MGQSLEGAWVITFDSGDDGEAVTVEHVYHDRDPYGEYLHFAASDSGAVTDHKISILNYRYLAEVRVTFEADLFDEGKSDVQWCKQDFEEQGAAFVKEIWPSWQDVTLNEIANSIFPVGQDYVMARSVLSVADDQASWLEVTRIEADQPAEMALTFCKVEQDRLLEIKAVLKDAHVVVGTVTALWEDLLKRFETLPYKPLTGAKRVEPDDEDFDVDTIGEVAGEA